MNRRSTIALLALFFAGLVGLWVADRVGVPTADARRDLATRVLPGLAGVDPESIDRVEIDGGPGPLAFVRRPDRRWRMVEPADARADGARLALLIEGLARLRRQADAGAIDADPTARGFDPPAAAVRLYRGDPAEPIATLDVGDAIQDSRYVRGDGPGRPIVVVPAGALAAIDADPAAWRDRRLIDLPTYSVAAVAAEGPGRSLRLERDGRDWRLTEPIAAAADPAKADELVARLTGLLVADGPDTFVADDEANLDAYGLAPPKLTVTLEPVANAPEPDRKPRRLHLGAEVPGKPDRAYARLDGEDDVILIDPAPLRDLGTDPRPFRSKLAAPFDPAKAVRVKIEAGGVEHRLARLGGDRWQVLAPAEGPADGPTVEALLRALAEAQTADFLDPSTVTDPRLDPPGASFEVVLRPEGGAGSPVPPPIRLAIGRYDPATKVVYARSGDDPAILVLPETVLKAVPRGPLAFLSRNLVQQDPRAIRRIEVTQADGATEAIEAVPGSADRGASWKLVAPIAAEADDEAAARVALLLARLRAEALVAPSADDPSTFGLDRPELAVAWNAGSPRTLRVGSTVRSADQGTAGSRYAQLDGRGLVFTIRPEAVALLGAELRATRLAPFAPERAGWFELAWPDGRTAAYERGGPAGWRRAAESAAIGPEPTEIAALIGALALVRASRFVQHEGPFPAVAGLTPPRLTVRAAATAQGPFATLRLGAPGPGATLHATTAAGDSGPVALVPAGPWEGLMAVEPDEIKLPEQLFAP